MCASETSRTAEIAEALQNKLDAYKAEKRELGSVSVHLTWEQITSFSVELVLVMRIFGRKPLLIGYST